jgi:hypothetical protein
MFVTIINDCQDQNAIARQGTRASALLGAYVTFVGVKNDIEAAGNLIDVLDAAGEEKGVVLVNVAPRNGAAKKWANGTPFCYFRYKNVLIVSSVDGYTLSLVKKIGIVEEVQLLDIPTVVNSLCKTGIITDNLKEHIIQTQFRSFEFVPRVAHWILGKIEVPSVVYSLEEVADINDVVWWVDNFGNIKTSVVQENTIQEDGSPYVTAIGTFPFYQHLKDVPDDQTAVVVGSSGIDSTRFLEIVVQGKSAEKQFEVDSGYSILD